MGNCCQNNPMVQTAKQMAALKVENARLSVAMTAARELLREVVWLHSDPDSPEYNECDKAECNWCERAKKLFDGGKNLASIRELLAPTIEVLSEHTFDEHNQPYQGPTKNRIEAEISRLQSIIGETNK